MGMMLGRLLDGYQKEWWNLGVKNWNYGLGVTRRTSQFEKPATFSKRSLS